MEKPAVNTYPIHELLRARWSPRAFSSRTVDLDQLFGLFEAARWSPSSGNLQPWAFIVTTPAGGDQHQAFVNLLTGSNAQWARNAPVLVLAVVKSERQPGKPNFWALYDLGQSVAHLTLQASAQGLFLRQMGGFDRERAREIFGVPEGYEPVTAIALGYYGDLDDLPEELREREMEARSRKALDTFVFTGRWNEPIRIETDEVVMPAEPGL